MTKKTNKKKQNFWKTVKTTFPYILTTALVIGVAFWGSQGKTIDEATGLNMQTLATNNYSASADQISEFFIVSELANTMNLATAEAVNINYNSLTTLAEAAQTTTDRFEKPTNIVGTCELQTGAVAHVVSEGDSIASLVSQYSNCGVTDTMIRWSNGIKNSAALVVGQTIYIPTRAGFVYKVKSGDTVASVAQKYGSAAAEIISANSLELDQTLYANQYILIPGGNLPENERPDYTPPVTTVASASAAAASTSYYYRLYWTASNPMPWGWCTWYAWARRAQLGGAYTLPGGLGNANTWDNALAGSFYIDGNPRPGDVFQTDNGYYGHVGYVESVNGDGTITISDMNGIAGWGRVGTQRISNWGQYRFIHQRK